MGKKKIKRSGAYWEAFMSGKCVLKGECGILDTSPFLLLPSSRGKQFSLPCVPAMVCHPHQGPKALGHSTVEGNLQNHEARQTFSFINWLPQIFCYSNGKQLMYIVTGAIYSQHLPTKSSRTMFRSYTQEVISKYKINHTVLKFMLIQIYLYIESRN
jgi:hypothetical protein